MNVDHYVHQLDRVEGFIARDGALPHLVEERDALLFLLEGSVVRPPLLQVSLVPQMPYPRSEVALAS